MIVRDAAGVPHDVPSAHVMDALSKRSVSEARHVADREFAAWSMAMTGVDLLREKRFAEARSYLSLAIELYQSAGSQLGFDRTTSMLAELEFAAGRPEVARDFGRALTSRNADPGFSANLAAYLYACNQLTEARDVARASVLGARSASRPFVGVVAMQTFAATNVASNPLESAQLVGYVTANLLASDCYYVDYTERYVRDAANAKLSAVLGEERYEAERARGARLHEYDAYAIVVRDDDPPVRLSMDGARASRGALVDGDPGDDELDAAGLAALSAREWTIAKRVARGMSNAAIAAELFLSRRTVETHVATILRKLNLRNRVLLASVISRIAPS